MRLFPAFIVINRVFHSFSCFLSYSDALMSVIEGVVYDPLIDNSLKSSERDQTYRRSADTTRRIMSYLRGTVSEGNMGKALSVASQVNTTIARASDDALLCQMFLGWAPWE